MTYPNPDAIFSRRPGQLNDSQQSRLRVTCQYIDKLLSDMEDVLHAATSPSPFPRYIVDLNPAQIRLVEDHIRRLRSQLVHALKWQDMKPLPPDIPATRAVLTNLNFIDIAVEELKPHYMRGFGQVPEDAVSELNGVVHELRSLITATERYLKQELDKDLDRRLQQLERSGFDVVLLRLLEQIATRNGLVEFRLRIDSLATRLEEDTFEVALFGRVSSGKSSMLNALLGTDVLPVGVNPITAVPTRLRYGTVLKAAVAYGDGRNSQVSLGEFAKLVTEQGNPGNLQNVTRAIVEVPSPRLQQGILLMDTPGLGSLARRGAAETLAYLPSCDLALLLIDSGTTLNEEDVGTLRLLYEAGISALVLLSKADLMANGDLHRTISYIEGQLKHELGITVTVHPVSALSRYQVLLDQFFERELLPRFEKARSLREASIARKIGALREAVSAALDSNLNREMRRAPRTIDDPTGIESTLRILTGEVGEQRTILDHAFRTMGEQPQAVLDAVANQVSTWLQTTSERSVAALQLSEWIHEAVNGFIRPPIENFREVGKRAISNLQSIANEMGRSDTPAHGDFDAILRDMPRFEMATLPPQINLGRWGLWGKQILRSRVRSNLRESVGPDLKDALHLYGMTLSQWSEQMVRKLELLVDSYAGAYRMQLQRLRDGSTPSASPVQIEADLNLLRNWTSAKTTTVTDTHP